MTVRMPPDSRPAGRLCHYRSKLAIPLSVLCLMLLSAQVALAMPPLPYSPWGTLTIDGAPAADGTVVTAWINGIQYARATTQSGYYAMVIPGDEAGTVHIEGGVEGQEIVFKTGDHAATLTGVWRGGTAAQLDLRVISASAPVADFDATPRQDSGPFAVQFSDRSTGTITSRLWDFGDTDTSTETSPAHRYTIAGSYTVTLAASGPAGSSALTRGNYITVTPIYEQRVRAGGGAYTDTLGNLWAADKPFAAGSWGYVGGVVSSTTAPISGSSDPKLYRTERYWTASAGPGYRFSVPNGQYQVSLLFSENSATAAGQRTFNVKAEGVRVLAGFDVFAAAGGKNTAISVTVPLTLSINVVDGELTLDFMKVTGNPKVNAIYVRWVGPYQNQVDAGSAIPVLTPGLAWSADRSYTVGAWGYANPVTASVIQTTTQPISNTLDDQLYQTARVGMASYRFAVPNGVYSVTLKFAEPQYNKAGKRSFDLKLAGLPVLSDMDIWLASGGRYYAIDYSYTVTVTNKLLNIRFTPRSGLPIINAIAVRQR